MALPKEMEESLKSLEESMSRLEEELAPLLSTPWDQLTRSVPLSRQLLVICCCFVMSKADTTMARVRMTANWSPWKRPSSTS